MYEYKRIDLKATSPAQLSALGEQGWQLVGNPFLIEKSTFGVVKHIFWMMQRRIGGGGECDLSEVWDELAKRQVAMVSFGGDFDRLVDRVRTLEQSGGSADFSTKHVDVVIYGGLENGIPRIQNDGAIRYEEKYTEAHVSGNILTARFTIANGGLLNEGTYYIKPHMSVSGYQAKNPLGIAKWIGNRHGQLVYGLAEWQRYANGWFIRMSSPNYDFMEAAIGFPFERHGLPERKVQMAGGEQWWGKRFPVTAQNDTILVTIPVLPV